MISLLNKDLSFAITPGHVNTSQLMADTQHCDRSLQWKFSLPQDGNNFDNESDSGDVVESIFRVKKPNLPSQAPPPLLKKYSSAVTSKLLAAARGENKCHSNISKSEQVALKTLIKAQENGEIVIKPADKGGGWVIMNSSDYISEMKSQLSAKFKQEDGSEIPFLRPKRPK